MQKGFETHFGEEDNETEAFQGALCNVSFSSSVSFSRQLHPPFFPLLNSVEAACAAQCLNVHGHGVRAAALRTLAPLVLQVMAGPSACWVSTLRVLDGAAVGFGFLTVLLKFTVLGCVLMRR